MNTPTMNDRKTVNIGTGVQRRQRGRRTIYNWLNAGKLEYVRTTGGSVRIFSDSLFRPAGYRA